MDNQKLIEKLNASLLKQKKWMYKIDGYFPSYFLKMVSDKGYYGAIKQLINKDERTQGFSALWERNRLDETVEYFVTTTDLGQEYEEYNELFTDEERLHCRSVLEQHDFDFKSKSIRTRL